MSQDVKLLLGIHCHQPVDNFGWVIDEAIARCYRPFFEVASRYPEFKFAVHYSGWLLETIKKSDKELFKLMQQSAEAGSVEFFSGGYYEPILASIPSKDRIDQINKLNKFIEKNFNQTPRGLWLTERVWDSSIIHDVKQCGIEYVIVDDYHFMTVGFEEQALKGYYTTEEGGEFLHIFPISKKLRYQIPFSPVEQSESCVLEFCGADGQNAAIIYDDGEKFGSWPGTYEWVYDQQWLAQFLERVRQNPAIQPMLYRDYVDSMPSLGNVYLPTVSYYEMGEWSLGARDQIDLEALRGVAQERGMESASERFVKGGIWKNFLIKYGEANFLHKRLLELSSKRKEMKSKRYDDALFRAETNDVLWHGVFGGLYLPNLRDNAYRYVIECENLRHKDLKSSLNEMVTLYGDGCEQVKLVSQGALALIDPKRGGQIVELDLRDARFNLQNTLQRRKESYHYKMEEGYEQQEQCEQESDDCEAVVQDAGSDGIDTIHSIDLSAIDQFRAHMRFDWHPRNSMMDHVTDYSFNTESFTYADYKDYGDFTHGSFEVLNTKGGGVELMREGVIHGERDFYAKLLKDMNLHKNRLDFRITLETECHYDLQYLLEWNLHFANLSEVTFNGKTLDDRTMFSQCEKLIIKDPYLQRSIRFEFNVPLQVHLFSIDTVSQSEGGFDLTNQGVALGFVQPFRHMMTIEGKVHLG